MANKTISILHIFLYKKIKERTRGMAYLQPKLIREIISRIYRIPKETHYKIIYELEEYKLLKRINHQKYKLLKSDCDRILDRIGVIDFWK